MDDLHFIIDLDAKGCLFLWIERAVEQLLDSMDEARAQSYVEAARQFLNSAAFAAFSHERFAEGIIDALDSLLHREVEVQLFQIFLESFAGEHGARMAAMDG